VAIPFCVSGAPGAHRKGAGGDGTFPVAEDVGDDVVPVAASGFQREAAGRADAGELKKRTRNGGWSFSPGRKRRTEE
jgi:hypothetical protein